MRNEPHPFFPTDRKPETESDLVSFRKLPGAPGCVLISPEPESLDLENLRRLRESARDALEAGYIRFVIDLSRLRHIPSRFIDSLGQLRSEAQARGGDLVLSNLNAETRDLFRTLDIDRRHVVSEDLEGAIDYLSSKPLFPRTEGCPACGRRLRLAAPGLYRCPACGGELEVSAAPRDRRPGARAVSAPRQSP